MRLVPRFGWRRILKGFALCSAVGVIVIAPAFSSAGASTARILTRGSIPTAKKLIAETQKMMSGQSSVHLTITSTDKSTKQSETVTEDAGTSYGLESIQFGSATASVRLTSKAAYISGNTAGLESIIGLSKSGAKTVDDKWIVVSKGSSQFTDIVEGGTIGPLTKSLFPSDAKSAKVKSKTLNGQDVFELTWTATSSSSKIDLALDIAAAGTRLPIQLTATEGDYVSITRFGRWGEHITVSVPTKTISYSKLVG